MENLFGCAGSSVARVRLVEGGWGGGVVKNYNPTGLHGLKDTSLTRPVTKACRRETGRLQGMFSLEGSGVSVEGFREGF